MDKNFAWDEEKNQWLIKYRSISFETVAAYLEGGDIFGTIQGKGKYSHQKQFMIKMNNYIYLVPFVEEKERYFLKTIIPSRKMTKQFLFGGQDEKPKTQ